MEFTLLFAALTGFGFAWGAVRILHRLGRIPAHLDKPFDILLGGGVVGLFSGRLDDPLPALDALAPAALVGLAGWQAGCVWRGACLGTVSDLPWAWAQPGSDIPRHPTELYAAVGFLVAAVVVTRLPHRPGLATGVGLAGAAAVRWLTQPLRPSLDAGPVGWYVAGLVVGLALVVFGPRIARVSVGADPG